MQKYNEGKAREIRDKIDETLNASIMRELNFYFNEITIAVSDVNFSKTGDAYVAIAIDCDKVSSHQCYFIYLKSNDEWIDTVYIMGEVMANIITILGVCILRRDNHGRVQ